MTNLESIQKRFKKSLLERELLELDFIKSPYPAERLNIYRHTVFENMCNSLAITFPGIWKLLGEECANSVAYAFCKQEQNLPTSGYLDDWGHQFPKFISSIKELQHLPYLKDYASYEWLKHQAYYAPHIPSIDLAELLAIAPDKAEQVSFKLIPSSFIFASNYPVEKIQEILDNPKAEPISLDVKTNYALIARPKFEVLTFWLDKDLWHFCSLIIQGLSLAQIMQKIKSLDLTAAIHFLLQNQLISKIIIRGENYND